MKKEFMKVLKYFQNKKRMNEKQFANALTPEQKALLLSEENSTIDELIAAIEAMPDDAENPEIAALKKMVEDLKTALAENQTEFENRIAALAEKATPKQFINFVKSAVEGKIFENAKGRTSIGVSRFENANNANLAVVYNDSEVGVKPSLVPTLLDYVRQISLNGQNAVAWNEIDGTTDASAIVVIGNDKPIRTTTHSTTTTGTDTLAVISKLPKQYRAAISMIADLYMNDMTKDITRKINNVILTLIAAGSDLADLMTVPTVEKAQMIDAIRAVASAIKNNHPENRVVIGLSQAALFELDSVKDANGNYITYDFAQKGIILVSLPVASPFTATSIVGMSEGIIRWYNDGIDNLVSEERYWDTNHIGLMVEVLNSVFVLRASDATATVFDDYTTIISDMGGGNQA
jgi:hypothetical protein